MRMLVVILLMVALAIATVGIAPAHRTDAAYERAHAAAVKYRARGDHLQQLLTRRVREVHGLRRTLLHRPSSLEALHLAAVVYHVPFTLLYRIASCESTGTDVRGTEVVSERTLYALAKNPTSTASGLAQFLISTWAGLPFADFSIYSPYANALALGHEVAHGNAGWQWAASKGCWS